MSEENIVLFFNTSSKFICTFDPCNASTSFWMSDAKKRCWLRTGCSCSETLSRPWANVLHQACFNGLVKHLLQHTGRISEWMAFGLSPFDQIKRIKERCSLRDALSSNVVIIINLFSVKKWTYKYFTQVATITEGCPTAQWTGRPLWKSKCYNLQCNVLGLLRVLGLRRCIYCLQMASRWRHRNKTHRWFSVLNCIQNVYFGFFYILKIKRMTPLCNLFMERPSYDVGALRSINIYESVVYLQALMTACLLPSSCARPTDWRWKMSSSSGKVGY